jgi:MazG family protein
MADTPPAPLAPPPAAPSPTAEGEFARLVAIVRHLRSAAGCPWDREQSWDTLKRFVLEEACEVIDAIERGDAAGLCGEVGDLVFEGVFLAQVGADRGAFTMRDALAAVNEKLIRRHPHVFASPDGSAGPPASAVSTPADVIAQWHEIKARERAEAGRTAESVLAGVPLTLPALARAEELGRRAARVGFDWPDAAGVIDKVEEEIAELREAAASGGRADLEAELGDLLFALAQWARKQGLDAEAALRGANARFSARFREVEARVIASGRPFDRFTLDELEALWQAAKARQDTDR